MTIYDPDSDKAWIHGEYLLTKIRRDKRPPFILKANSKRYDEQQAYKYYLKEYERIWEDARPINTKQDMEYNPSPNSPISDKGGSQP